VKKLILIVLVVSLIVGCATFNKIVTNNELVMQLATEATTARVIHEHPEWKKPAIEITAGVITAIDARTVVNLEDIEAIVKSRIKWSVLLPEEQALLSTLISEARRGIENSLRSQGNKQPEMELIEVRKLLVWINEAAKRQ